MVDPQRMVLISITSSIIVLLILFFYFKFYKKKTTNYVFILLLICFPPTITIFRPGSYESGDLSLHTMRLMSFYNILFNEYMLPRWTPEFNAGYGDPHFIFSYFLPYFIGSVFHFIGFSFLDSIKLLLAGSFILSGLAMYIWAKDELGKKAGFVAAVFYLFAPYHLIDLHFRVTIAETLSFVYLPFLLLLTKKIIYHPTTLNITLGGICYSLLILTHQIITVIFTPVLIFYAIFVWYQKEKKGFNHLLVYFFSIVLGFLLSAFYWLPIVAEAKYTQASLSKNTVTFTPLTDLLYSSWRFGFLFQGHKGELSFLIGYSQLFVVIAAIYLLYKKQFDKKTKRFLLFFIILFCLVIFMIIPQSKEIWINLPFFNFSQYSYRLLEIVAICTSIIAGVVVKKWKKNSFIIILCLITVFYTILNWGNRKTISYIQDTYLAKEFEKKPDIPIYLEPSSPIWVDLKKSKVRSKPKAHIEILSGKAIIKDLSRTSTRHTYTIHADTKVDIKENTVYFPGWKLYVDGKEKTISYTQPEYPGIILFSLPKGVHEVQLIFSNTKPRSISLFISATTIFFLLVFLFYSIIKNHRLLTFER